MGLGFSTSIGGLFKISIGADVYAVKVLSDNQFEVSILKAGAEFSSSGRFILKAEGKGFDMNNKNKKINVSIISGEAESSWDMPLNHSYGKAKGSLFPYTGKTEFGSGPIPVKISDFDTNVSFGPVSVTINPFSAGVQGTTFGTIRAKQKAGNLPPSTFFILSNLLFGE